MMRPWTAKCVGHLLLTWLLVGCASTGPKTTPSNPDVALPYAFRNAHLVANATDAAPDNVRWWMRYDNAELNALVERALIHNADLRIAALQVKQAGIRAEQARAGKLPLLTAPIRGAAQGSGGTADTQQSSQLAIQGSYRVDIWGEQQAIVDSADMAVWRAKYDQENLQRNMIGNLVATFISYLVLQDSIQMAVENQTNAAEILKSLEQRLSLGDATLDEVEQQRATLALLQTVMPALENQRDDAITAMSRFVGALPGSLVLKTRGLDELSVPALRVDVPASLIFTRPDIKAVEARLRAANANIELARARLLPPLDLVFQTGFSGLAVAQLFEPNSFFWGTAASFVTTLFDGGRRQSDKDFADAYYAEMAETYRQVVFQSVREVESAISVINTTQRRLAAQTRNNRATLNIFKTTTDAFMLRAVDSIALLEARKNYQRSLEDVIRTKAELLRAHANFSLAVGGERQPYSEQPNAAATEQVSRMARPEVSMQLQ